VRDYADVYKQGKVGKVLVKESKIRRISWYKKEEFNYKVSQHQHLLMI
jgi:hypothetical protein